MEQSSDKVMPTFKTYIELEVEVEYSGTPLIPAKVSGPPESCYPEEGGEVEIQSIVINPPEEYVGKIPDAVNITGVISSKCLEAIEEEASEHWIERQRGSGSDERFDG